MKFLYNCFAYPFALLASLIMVLAIAALILYVVAGFSMGDSGLFIRRREAFSAVVAGIVAVHGG